MFLCHLKSIQRLQQPLMLSLKCIDTETWDSFMIYQPYLSHISVLSVYLHFSRAICSCSVWAHYDNTSFTHSDGGDTIHKLRSAQFEIKINFIVPAWIFVLCTEGAPRTRKGTNQSYNQQSRLFRKPCSELNNWLSLEGGKKWSGLFSVNLWLDSLLIKTNKGCC